MTFKIFFSLRIYLPIRKSIKVFHHLTRVCNPPIRMNWRGLKICMHNKFIFSWAWPTIFTRPKRRTDPFDITSGWHPEGDFYLWTPPRLVKIMPLMTIFGLEKNWWPGIQISYRQAIILPLILNRDQLVQRDAPGPVISVKSLFPTRIIRRNPGRTIEHVIRNLLAESFFRKETAKQPYREHDRLYIHQAFDLSIRTKNGCISGSENQIFAAQMIVRIKIIIKNQLNSKFEIINCSNG